MTQWFDDAIIGTGRLPLLVLFVAFLATFLFIRLSVRMIRAGVRWWPGNVTPGGLHVHHVVFGLVAMLVAGMGLITLASYETPVADCALAGLFGIGAALVLDEFALVLYLKDVYWAEQGRLSVDAVFVAVAVIALFILGLRPYGVGDYEQDRGAAAYAGTTVILLALLTLTAVTMLKGKFWTGLVGLFVWPLLVFGAVRLSRPGAPWARWRYGLRPARMARAQQREDRFHAPVARAKKALQEAVGGGFGVESSFVDPMPTAPDTTDTAVSRAQRLVSAVEWCQTRRRLRSVPLWRVPAVLTVGAAVLALVLVGVDETVVGAEGAGVGGAGSSAAATMLSVIAGGMITLGGLVFTALTLAMQFGAAQLSVRVVPMLQQGRIIRWSIGVFLATFVFALIIALDLAADSSGDVPLVSVVVAMGLTLLSTGMFIALVARVAHVLNPTRLLSEVAREGRAAVSRTYPREKTVAATSDSAPAEATDDKPAVDDAADGVHPVRGDGRETPGDDAYAGAIIPLRHADPAGQVLLAVHVERIARLAARWGVHITVVPAVGQFVSAGAPLFAVQGPMARVRPDLLARSLVFGDTHSPSASPAAALQALVDVALKALSPAVNDPSRAVQSFDYIEDLLVLLSRRVVVGATTGRLHGSPLTWEDYVSVAVDEIRHFSGESLMVLRRLRAVLTGLLDTCPEALHPPLRERIDALDAAVRRTMPDELDLRLARVSDPLGLGSRRVARSR
ncbi:DUF2254 domain-containing protein [Tomitella fengzijianii]|uniref:DUF2254 domain-containing protein n=1 Tax=Tomitella fengzijianii TaxID=2597660 RepID=A0A516X118_9ACTN|nr:DUF2254 family protein [Tomitella fengzijianii]QDQ96301.1 DUF2254 domain-containing protein [Tomitella fengzijianii]